MTPRITTTGRDSFTPPVAMTEARRFEVYGPVAPMAQESRCWLALSGYAILLAGAVIGVGLYGGFFA